MRSLLLVPALLLPLLFGSCASHWTEAQKAQLTSLAVAPAINSDAYVKPIGNEQYSAPIITTGTGGFAAGAAAGAAAQLVVEIAAAAQQKMFESRYADAIARAPGTIPGDLPGRIRKSVGKHLGSHAFLKGKISDASSNRFVVTVENYRYVRAGKNDDILVTPVFFGKFELIASDGKKLLSRGFTAAGDSKRPLTAFANDKALTSRAFDEAIERIGLQALNAVGEKLGDAQIATDAPVATHGTGGPVQLEPVNGGTATCNKPYKLTQTCNIWSGAGLKIKVGGQKLKLAGSADGKVILIREDALVAKNVSTTGSPQYDAVRNTLRASGIKILRQRDMVMVGNSVGFFLELDGDGYSALAKFRS